MFSGRFCRVQCALLRFMTVCVETSLSSKPISKQTMEAILCLSDRWVVDAAEEKAAAKLP